MVTHSVHCAKVQCPVDSASISLLVLVSLRSIEAETPLEHRYRCECKKYSTLALRYTVCIYRFVKTKQKNAYSLVIAAYVDTF